MDTAIGGWAHECATMWRRCAHGWADIAALCGICCLPYIHACSDVLSGLAPESLVGPQGHDPNDTPSHRNRCLPARAIM